MFPSDPAVDVLAWLLFSLVLIWAIWQGVPEFTNWLAHDAEPHDDIHFFPDEVRGEPGPRILAASGAEVDPERSESGTAISGRS
jgi:hypothetical protein